MTRAPGSGLYADASTAIEELWAAVVSGSRAREYDWTGAIDFLHARGKCGVSGAEVRTWFHELSDQLGLSVASAQRDEPDLIADVSGRLPDGSPVYFELKAQTTKDRFEDITQADWVRNATGGTHWLCSNDRGVASSLRPGERAALMSAPVPATWSFEAALLSDLLLLTDDGQRRLAGATSVSGLHTFAARKFLVHVIRYGARAIRLADLTPVAALQAGKLARTELRRAGSSVGVWANVGAMPSWGNVHFSYNMGYSSTVLGRHKLHGAPIASDPWVFSDKRGRL